MFYGFEPALCMVSIAIRLATSFSAQRPAVLVHVGRRGAARAPSPTKHLPDNTPSTSDVHPADGCFGGFAGKIPPTFGVLNFLAVVFRMGSNSRSKHSVIGNWLPLVTIQVGFSGCWAVARHFSSPSPADLQKSPSTMNASLVRKDLK